ncbi:MAG: hypothetical protein HKN47_28270 [Pirellulaceae bacterium]|nr:hypothetical protein [Pirellulaceae bacterium]
MRPFLSLFCIISLSVISGAAELSSREKTILNAINSAVGKAGADYSSGDYASAGEQIRKAMNQIDVAVKVGTPDLYDALDPAMKRISKAHAMLEFEGVSLPPFRKPARPDAAAMEAKPDPPKSPTRTTPPTPNPDPNAISFTKQVAPILANRCGQCHIQGSKGQFNLGTFAMLMKGPPEGVVVFAEDTIGSRLIETIETGDMPRGGGKVSPPELAILKGWIMQGAKFDGQDPNAPIAGGVAAAPAATQVPEVKRATGNETVSFARDVAPLLVGNCNGCHINAMQDRGGLRMDNFTQILKGGDSGQIIIPGKGDDSLLIKKLKGMGIEGDRMPAGGRPALADKEIQLISTWIDEGATLDGASAMQPITVMSQLAWAANATTDQMNEKRQELAGTHMDLVATSGTPVASKTTEHFYVMGTSSQGTIDLVAQQAEAHMKAVKLVARGGDGDEFFHGKATIFVLPRRYDYSEFAKMVEGRSVPSDWTGHWKFDGIDAYAAVVATDRDEEDEIADRLLAPLASLAVATRGGDIPRWFAEGVGANVAGRTTSKDRDVKLRLQAETSEALASCKDAKAFLDGKLNPVHTDRLGAAMVSTMMDRKNRKQFDACLRSVADDVPFESAFAKSFRAPVNTWINNWLAWARGS